MSATSDFFTQIDHQARLQKQQIDMTDMRMLQNEV